MAGAALLPLPRGSGVSEGRWFRGRLPQPAPLQRTAASQGFLHGAVESLMCPPSSHIFLWGSSPLLHSQPGREALSTPTWPWPLGVPLHPEKPALFPSPLDAPPDPAPTWGPSASSWTPAAASQLLPCSSALWPLLHHGALQMPLLTLHLIPSASPSPFHA